LKVEEKPFQIDEDKRPTRIAASSYLNTAPLIWSFQAGTMRDSVKLVTDAAPARCAEMLARGAADAALVPAIEYQRLPDLRVARGVCVGARSRVRSVVLVVRRGKELGDARRVALDVSSRTSVALTQIIFREFLAREPEWISSEPDLNRMLEVADAALLIGDPAMQIPPSDDLRVYDLAELWREQTGLGFAFALWMAPAGASERRARAIRWSEARDEGLRNVDEIAAQYERKLKLSRAELRSYLLENICYELDEGMLAGLDLFYRLARKHGIIETVRTIEFLG
jgi:chorismate dehydratase